jgi:hypothetical protein
MTKFIAICKLSGARGRLVIYTMDFKRLGMQVLGS